MFIILARWAIIMIVVISGGLYLMQNYPAEVNSVVGAMLTFIIGIAVIGLGFWVMARPFRRPGGRQNRRRH
ncbi:MAG: hypothetical protein Q7R58_02660 [bacterium]|nr:hypothetical protein [bacterium]